MKTHDLIQGSPEWHVHRATHYNASDAPAMMGCSPYETRTQLLHRLHTGISPEVDAATQRRFDDGHRFEALARPLAMEIIGEGLYPVTGSEGKLSASFDGLTMDDSINFEHKSLNSALRAVMVEGCAGADLPLVYRVQMEQQHMVSNAEKTLFMASKWEGEPGNETLVEERHCWYTPDADLAAQIEAGWRQIDADRATYVPAEVVEAKPTGRAPETLPALLVTVKGEVTASNLAEFKQTALTAIRSVNRDLKTDQDFADADKAVKWCGDIEERVAGAKQHALSQTATIDELFKAMDDISAEARQVRLDLDKLIKARKEAIKGEIVAGGIAALREHIAGLNTRLGKPYMPTVAADFAGAIKNKRTVDSLRESVNNELTRAKIESSAIADKIQINLATLRELAGNTVENPLGYAFLFADTAQIVLKAPDDLTMLVKSRIADHKAAEEKKEAETRERIRKEEQDRLAREAEAKKKAEDIAAAAAKHIEPAPSLETVVNAVAPTAVAQALFPAANVVPMRTAAAPVPAAPPSTPPTMKLGDINALLSPIGLTVDGLTKLGFPPAATDKNAKLYHASDLTNICGALHDLLDQVQSKQAA